MSNQQQIGIIAQSIANGIPAYETHALPFETWYDACDMETRQQIKISSGEVVHAIVLPDADLTLMLGNKVVSGRKKIMVSPQFY